MFAAVHHQTGMQVAIKVVYKQLLDQYQFHSQMRKEQEIQYRLGVQHPNILKLYGYFYDQKHIYSVLEVAPMGNLYQ